MIRLPVTHRNLPSRPSPPVQPVLPADRAYVAWLLLAIAEDRAESAPFFEVQDDGRQ